MSMGDDRNESCGICIAGPRSVRFLPCGHGGICELCTVKCVKANGLICTNCRCAVSKLAVMPVTMATVAAGQVPQPQRMPTHLAVPEPEGHTFESVEAFLQAKLGSDDAEVAERARAALALMSGQGEEEKEEEEVRSLQLLHLIDPSERWNWTSPASLARAYTCQSLSRFVSAVTHQKGRSLISLHFQLPSS